MTAAAGSSYPATLTLDAPLQVARWRPLVAWLLAIPHFVVLYVLNAVAEVTAIISWFAILFTGKDLEGLQGLRCMTLRYQLRTITLAGFMNEPYPPFTFATTPADPGDHQGIRVDIAPQLEDRNRLTTFFRLILVIPHFVVLAILGIAAGICVVVGWFAVLITGGWPEGLRGFVVNVLRWQLRATAYLQLLTDEYPPFELS